MRPRCCRAPATREGYARSASQLDAQCALFSAQAGNLRRDETELGRPMRAGAGGRTTVFQRILERRAGRPAPTQEETTATIAVMLRVVPPSKALLVCQNPGIREQLERRMAAGVLECESVPDEAEAVQGFAAAFCPVVVTDSSEVVRKLRARTVERAPFILYIAELDEAAERQAGLEAGADDSVGRR